MAKTKEELNELKEEIETLNEKLGELNEDELKEVCGGVNIPDFAIPIKGLETIGPYAGHGVNGNEVLTGGHWLDSGTPDDR